MMNKELMEIAKRIAKKTETAVDFTVTGGYTSDNYLVFNCYCLENNVDHAITKVKYHDGMSDLDICKAMLEKTNKNEIEFYYGTELEKQLNNYIEKYKIDNAYCFEGELNVEIGGIELDPIDLKYYSGYDLEISNGDLELTIKYADDNEIFIENVDNQLWVGEYNENGEECCVIHHEANCDCDYDYSFMGTLQDALQIYKKKIEKLNETIKEKDGIIEKLTKENLLKNINMSQEEIVKKSKELDEYFKMCKLINNIRF